MGCASAKLNGEADIGDSAGLSTMGAPRHDPRWWRDVDAEALAHAWCCDEDARAAQSMICKYERQETYYQDVWRDAYGERGANAGERERLLHGAFRWLEGALLAAERSAAARRAAKALLGVWAFGRHLDLVLTKRSTGATSTGNTSSSSLQLDLFAQLQVQPRPICSCRFQPRPFLLIFTDRPPISLDLVSFFSLHRRPDSEPKAACGAQCAAGTLASLRGCECRGRFGAAWGPGAACWRFSVRSKPRGGASARPWCPAERHRAAAVYTARPCVVHSGLVRSDGVSVRCDAHARQSCPRSDRTATCCPTRGRNRKDWSREVVCSRTRLGRQLCRGHRAD